MKDPVAKLDHHGKKNLDFCLFLFQENDFVLFVFLFVEGKINV